MRFLAICALTISGFGQTAPRSFEVASIKVREGAPQWKFAISGTRLSIESYTLFGLVKEAYDLPNYQIERSAAPPLFLSNDTLYDVTAKAEGDASPSRAEFRLMLQALLADRFHLRIHRAPKEMPVYVLIPGKNGPKFKPSAPDADATVHVKATGSNYQFYELLAPRETMDDLASNLSGVVDLPVLNKTGLAGTYDIKLNYTPQFKMGKGPEPDSSELSVFTAVQEQLGLKLESQKASLEVLVIDHVEKPSEN